MSDFLVDLGSNPFARKVIQQLGLPVPLPAALERDAQPWQARPLVGKRAIVGGASTATQSAALRSMLAEAGAEVVSPEQLGEGGRPELLLFDASAVADVAGLRGLYDFFQPRVATLAPSGRVVVVARELELALSPEAAGVQAAVEGFVRSVAKEVGKRGATANLVRVGPGAGGRIAPVLRFLLSARSAFITGQPLLVTARAKELAAPPAVRPLAGKTALVTGAARGIGNATARLLAQEGAKVLLLDRPQDGEPLARSANQLGGIAVQADLSDPAATAAIVEAVQQAGGLDILVHNAGITRDKTLARMKPEQWDGVLAVNLAAIVRLTAALEPQLRAFGRIVCLSSVAGIAGNVGQTAYAASKAGVMGFVRAQGERLASQGITVNAVAPGFIETRMTEAMPFAIREVARRLSALSQGGRPDDVAQAITFLASPGAQGLTGQTLRVCGGALVGA